MPDFTILDQTELSVLRCEYHPGGKHLVLQELSATGLVDLTLDHGHLTRILRLLPTDLLGAAMIDRGASFHLQRPAEDWPPPLSEADAQTLALLRAAAPCEPGMLELDDLEEETL